MRNVDGMLFKIRLELLFLILCAGVAIIVLLVRMTVFNEAQVPAKEPNKAQEHESISPVGECKQLDVKIITNDGKGAYICDGIKVGTRIDVLKDECIIYILVDESERKEGNAKDHQKPCERKAETQ